jgi:hypothetical protein
MDTSDLKRRAGITENEEHAYAGVPQIAATFKNGNIADAFAAIGNDVSLFARVANYLRMMDEPEFLRLLKIAGQRGQ